MQKQVTTSTIHNAMSYTMHQQKTKQQTLEHQALAKLIQKANLHNLLFINKLQKAGQDFGPRFLGRESWAKVVATLWAET